MPSAVAPSKADDQSFRRALARLEQQSASPGAARELLWLSRAADVGPVLSDIRMPVLALHRRGDRCPGIENAREIAGNIDGAMLVELPGDGHLPYADDSDRTPPAPRYFRVPRAGRCKRASLVS